MRILIAEDDAPLSSLIAGAFTQDGHHCDVAASGERALARLSAEQFDVLILDLRLPGMSGEEVLRRLRRENPDVGVLILTATDAIGERVACLDAGADDYLTKPFAFSELSARVRALQRRQARHGEAVLKIEDLELDRIQRTVKRGGHLIELTPREFSLLEYFMLNMGRRITRNMIIEHVWKLSPDTATNVVDVYVNYLRKKVDEGARTRLIHTLRRVGYTFGPAQHHHEEELEEV
ncbi:MAG TPA: response regulator transcription factor [Terriglobales bacterium]|nr:response regulator transcription factor [Terriglobales bacterium]